MAAAVSLSMRGMGRTGDNPSVGCIIVRDGLVVGRGWTQPGGRPHAEAMALAQAGDAVRAATVYVTLEPCAHQSERGPACADILSTAAPARVVIALPDPDPRTSGQGIARLKAAGIAVETGLCATDAARMMAGYLTRRSLGRPQITLKLATSLDGRIALLSGESQWITGPAARAHSHLERALHDAILVGAGTVRTDQPKLDVRLAGLEARSPVRIMLGRGAAPMGWTAIKSVPDISALPYNRVMVEGGAVTASAFLAADLVDRLLLYRAPVLLGAGKSAVDKWDIGALASAHGRWQLLDRRQLGPDALEIYQRAR